MNAILYIDGENFRKSVNKVFKETEHDNLSINFAKIDLASLLSASIPDVSFDKKRFYGARLHVHEETKDHSYKLIRRQRALKTTLEKQGVEFIYAGNVRAQEVIDEETEEVTTVFKEKGVDVRLAVDLVCGAVDGEVENAYVLSSDSDLQPAVAEAKRRGAKVTYVGFEIKPNEGLVSRCDRTVLIRSSDVTKYCPSNLRLIP